MTASPFLSKLPILETLSGYARTGLLRLSHYRFSAVFICHIEQAIAFLIR